MLLDAVVHFVLRGGACYYFHIPFNFLTFLYRPVIQVLFLMSQIIFILCFFAMYVNRQILYHYLECEIISGQDSMMWCVVCFSVPQGYFGSVTFLLAFRFAIAFRALTPMQGSEANK